MCVWPIRCFISKLLKWRWYRHITLPILDFALAQQHSTQTLNRCLCRWLCVSRLLLVLLHLFTRNGTITSIINCEYLLMRMPLTLNFHPYFSLFLSLEHLVFVLTNDATICYADFMWATIFYYSIFSFLSFFVCYLPASNQFDVLLQLIVSHTYANCFSIFFTVVAVVVCVC